MSVPEQILTNSNFFLILFQKNEDISEEIFGVLRSAAGKARLLATQKMQQFEGKFHSLENILGQEL